MSLRPCLGCGDPTTGSRCPDCAIPRPSRPSTPPHPKLRTAQWERLSKRLRKLTPFCELCEVTENLTVDHVIPLSQDDALAYVIENLRVLCRSCNSRRAATCTDEERQRVHDAIAASRRRRTAV